MSLLDFFKSGGSGPKAQDYLTPGVEQLLSAVPLLLGQYESGRGSPIGGPLQTLGQLGMTNAQNRIGQHQEEADVASQMESQAARGLLPGGQDFYKSIGPGTSPKAASTILTNIENTEQTKQQNELARQQAQEDYINKLQYHAPVFPGNGDLAYTYDAQGHLQRAPQFDKSAKDAKTKQQLLIRGIQTGDMGPYRAFEAQETADAVDRVGKSKAAAFNSLLSSQLKRLPLAAIPGVKGLRPIDLDTLSVGRPKDGTGEWADTSKYAWVDNKTATEVIPQIKGMVAATRDLANYTKGMPAATGSTAWNLVNTSISGLGIHVAARGGSPAERAFMANRIRLALMMQKVLTTSSRPLNLVEYNRVTGDAEGLSAEGEALIPTSTDTRESASAKERQLIGMAREKFQDLGLDSPVSHYYMGLVRDSANAAASMPSPEETSAPTAEETPTGTDEEGWKTF